MDSTKDAQATKEDDPPFTVRDMDHLEKLLLEGLNGGPGIEVTPEYVEQERKRLMELFPPVASLKVEERTPSRRAQKTRLSRHK